MVDVGDNGDIPDIFDLLFHTLLLSLTGLFGAVILKFSIQARVFKQGLRFDSSAISFHSGECILFIAVNAFLDKKSGRITCRFLQN